MTDAKLQQQPSTAAEKHRRNLEELKLNILAGSSCTAFSVAVFNPLDTVRIRWQVATAEDRALGIRGFARKVVANEGFVRGFWVPGCVAHSSAVAVSSGMRLGFYPTLRDLLAGDKDKSAFHMWLAGFSAGAVGFTIANPLFQAKVRLQVTAHMKQRPYASMTDCLVKMAREEGLPSLMRGSSTLMVRGALLSAGAQLGYDYTKTEALRNGVEEGPLLHVVASIASAFLASTFSAPCDFIMTKYQAAPALGIRYNGIFDCVQQIVRQHGVLELYKGWTPLFFRLAPLWTLNMPLYENVRKLMGLGYMT
ncbi:Mitochondrial substrate carrier family protein ucpB [Hondaea fermentalgiana]|uniref:Mitochondrial substrate carrier family protein ucpB n=1 Tax=Hondaea fermentalgiana TaxID=2315210 RepID=A0A2R5GH41_9STRA|nr:Mitochondrial substrate carrier family protein ucpB [Hondaea fermentalgiana]|eukprot:GBG30226.1 Mitochondrial substrate carrier family protein ucpB [Hondaea fermentalgiana]